LKCFLEAENRFEEAGKSQEVAHILSTISFFGGIGLSLCLDFVLYHVCGFHDPDIHIDRISDKDKELTEIQKLNRQFDNSSKKTVDDEKYKKGGASLDLPSSGCESEICTSTIQDGMMGMSATEAKTVIDVGLSTAVALALHNFPEGIVTFISTLSNPTFGIGVAIAIAIHNIPEGIAVSIPIYYATGSKWKAFSYSMLAGLAEPLGALVAYLMLRSLNMNMLLFAAVLGMVAGIMVLVAVHKIIPLAFRSDSSNRYASSSILGGMGIMGASLILIQTFAS